jgi:streptogramin lyase
MVFSVCAGGGRIWGGTFIPLTLCSYDPATGLSQGYGNPTKTGGEIYNLAFSGGKLYMASYTGATITRYDPTRPWRLDDSLQANPAHLGRIKSEGLPLQRPHGKAMDPAGRVYFAAHGGYGCYDSGLCRIDPATDEMTSWIYPRTNFGALVYLPATRQLLVTVARRRRACATLVSPEDGRVVRRRS